MFLQAYSKKENMIPLKPKNGSLPVDAVESSKNAAYIIEPKVLGNRRMDYS